MPTTNLSAAFWDTSAIVLLCCRQPESSVARTLARRWRRMVVWWAMPVEARGAFARLAREGVITDAEREQALGRLRVLRQACAEIQPTEEVRSLAEDLPERHRLRAADAFQLAAALVHCGQRPSRRPFVCFDERLALAAMEAGFAVVPRLRA